MTHYPEFMPKITKGEPLGCSIKKQLISIQCENKNNFTLLSVSAHNI